MSDRALRPVHELTKLARRVTASGLGERIAAPARDAEFNELIRVFNQMMDRLERSFFQTSRFSADAAHELRTPLTILQAHLEQMLQAVEPGSGTQQELGDMLEEIHRIKSILEKLLLLARMDAGQVQLHLVPLDLGALVENVLEDVEALAPGITVESRIEPGIRVGADAALLETAIQNLGNNAIKYNLEQGGRIVVELPATRGGHAWRSPTPATRSTRPSATGSSTASTASTSRAAARSTAPAWVSPWRGRSSSPTTGPWNWWSA
jgi:signal transduction histidine kinase